MLQVKYFNGVKILSVDKKELEKKLKKIVGEIKKDKNVKEIICFGSFFKDEFNPTSDIDIAIIVEKSKRNFIERSDDFIDYFKNLKIDVNMVVYTKEEFKKMLKQKNSFMLEIKSGKIL